ncbi:hypothetical protein FDECE_14415 [Fusarium decemcellulare]|nr:hypothetical protein FDECE_14415 [Fusarium decemcellulare]
MLNVAVSGIAIRGVYAGMGTRDEKLNPYLQNEGRKFLWFWQITYCFSLIFLKGSICMTLLRIAVVKAHRVIIWSTLVFSTVMTGLAIIALFLICRPISTAWGSPGTCVTPVFIMALGYIVSSVAVITDLIVAVLPIFMLWDSRMKMATKVSVGVILGLASLASLCTIIRFPYVKYYTIIPDYLHNCAHLILWSIVECGIGIVAGSLPSLRKLVSGRFHFVTTKGSSPAQATPFSGSQRAVITSNSVSASAIRRPHRGAEALGLGEGQGDWEQLDDASTSQKIYVKEDLEMQSLERLGTSRGLNSSSEDLVQ